MRTLQAWKFLFLYQSPSLPLKFLKVLKALKYLDTIHLYRLFTTKYIQYLLFAFSL